MKWFMSASRCLLCPHSRVVTGPSCDPGVGSWPVTTDGAVPTLVSTAPGLSGVNSFIVRAFVSDHPRVNKEASETSFICPLCQSYDSDAARANWYNLEIFAFVVCSYFASLTNYGGVKIPSAGCIIVLGIKADTWQVFQSRSSASLVILVRNLYIITLITIFGELIFDVLIIESSTLLYNHIDHKATLHPYVLIFYVSISYPSVLLYNHIDHKGTLHLHVLI